MKKNYSDSDPLFAITKAYNEATRMLEFHSVPIEADRLQEALDIIKDYNAFDSKTVGPVLLKKFTDCRFIVGRESSVVVYVVPKVPYYFWPEHLQKVQEEASIDEVCTTSEGRVRLWWD